MIYKYLGKIDFEPQGFIASDYFSNNNDSITISETNHSSIKDLKMYLYNSNYYLLINYLDGTSFSGYETTDSNYQQLLFLKLGASFEIICKIVFTTNSMRSDFVHDFCYPLVNCIFFYLLNSPKNKVEKNLIFISCSEVQYTKPITYKRFQLDMKRSAIEESFNYIYLTVLERYYFVEDSVLTNDFNSLQLTEDVLSSFSNLIYSQTAFVERNEYDLDPDKVDPLVTYDYNKSVEKLTTFTVVNDIFPSTLLEDTRLSCIITTIAM